MAGTVGLIGCGNWGKYILRDLLLLHCRVHVADTDAEARKTALDDGAAEVFENSDLPPCDGYVVAVPIPGLAPTCLDLLKHDKPIFVEKTLCLSLETVEQLELAGGDKYIFPMHKWRHHPGIEALRVVVKSGKIGELKEIATTRHGWVKDFHGGDVFWTQAVHDLTIIRHILGHLPDRINCANAIVNQHGLPVGLTASMGQDPVVHLSVSGRHAQKLSSVCINGTAGSATLYSAYDDHITVRNENGEEKIAIDTTFPLFLELKEFVAYLQGGPKPLCNMENAREVTTSLLALREATEIIPGSCNG